MHFYTPELHMNKPKGSKRYQDIKGFILSGGFLGGNTVMERDIVSLSAGC